MRLRYVVSGGPRGSAGLGEREDRVIAGRPGQLAAKREREQYELVA